MIYAKKVTNLGKKSLCITIVIGHQSCEHKNNNYCIYSNTKYVSDGMDRRLAKDVVCQTYRSTMTVHYVEAGGAPESGSPCRATSVTDARVGSGKPWGARHNAGVQRK